MHKVLVTGARGYVGGRLVRHLTSRGYNVVGTSRSAHCAETRSLSDVELIQLSPQDDASTYKQALRGVDAIVHLAASNEIESAAEPDTALIDTAIGTRRLVHAASLANVERFIFMSTIHVYGKLIGDLHEYSPTRPTHPYAIAHLTAEHFVDAATINGHLLGASVRLSNAIGAPARAGIDRWTLVGNDLPRQAVDLGALTIKSPAQWRDFISLRDVCAGLELLIAAPGGAAANGVFNLGGAMPLTISELGKLVSAAATKVLCKPIPIVSEASQPSGSTPPFIFRIDRMRDLGFQPSGLACLSSELEGTIQTLINKPPA